MTPETFEGLKTLSAVTDPAEARLASFGRVYLELYCVLSARAFSLDKLDVRPDHDAECVAIWTCLRRIDCLGLGVDPDSTVG